MRRQRGQETASESLRGFLMVQDKYDFFNIGFTNAVDGRAYLTCADCDLGPLGYHDHAVPNAFYIAAERVATRAK